SKHRSTEPPRSRNNHRPHPGGLDVEFQRNGCVFSEVDLGSTGSHGPLRSRDGEGETGMVEELEVLEVARDRPSRLKYLGTYKRAAYDGGTERLLGSEVLVLELEMGHGDVGLVKDPDRWGRGVRAEIVPFL